MMPWDAFRGLLAVVLAVVSAGSAAGEGTGWDLKVAYQGNLSSATWDAVEAWDSEGDPRVLPAGDIRGLGLGLGFTATPSPQDWQVRLGLGLDGFGSKGIYRPVVGTIRRTEIHGLFLTGEGSLGRRWDWFTLACHTQFGLGAVGRAAGPSPAARVSLGVDAGATIFGRWTLVLGVEASAVGSAADQTIWAAPLGGLTVRYTL